MANYTLEEKKLIREYLKSNIEIAEKLKIPEIRQFMLEIMKAQGKEVRDGFEQFSDQMCDTVITYLKHLMKSLI